MNYNYAKSRQTLLERYGVDNPMKIAKVAKKVGQRHAETMRRKYGDRWASELFRQVAEKHGGVNPVSRSVRSSSSMETDLIAALVDLGLPRSSIIHGDWKVLDGKEIDVYLPDYALGIELCGEYWHSTSVNHDKTHMAKKYELAKQKGVRLLTFFDTEWKSQKQQVLNLIASYLFDFPVIDSRKCKLVPVAKSMALAFINANHAEPIKRLTSAMGLIGKDGRLLGVCAVDRGRIVRICTRLGVKLKGGARRMIAGTMTAMAVDSITLLSNNRLSAGNETRLGFHAIRTIPPRKIKGKHKGMILYDCGGVVWEN